MQTDLGLVDYGPTPTDEDMARIADVCVVGSGASGSIVAATLAEAGLDVVVLEQGPFVSPDMSYDDLEDLSERAWVRKADGVWAKIGYPWSSCNVGGGTVFYGGISFRHRYPDFNAEELLGGGEWPLEWPWKPHELEPFYNSVERRLGVSGGPGDPTLPPGHSYPLPPLAQTPSGRAIADGARSLGLHPFPTPMAINSLPYGGRPACSRDNDCVAARCEKGAKGDSFSVFLKSLVERGTVRLFAGMKAARITAASASQATGVECVQVNTGKRFLFRAKQIVVACNAIQSAALLLRSADTHSPHGLGNQFGLVGRGLCMKANEYVVAYRRSDRIELPLAGVGPNGGVGPCSTVAIADYYTADDAPGGIGGMIFESAEDAHPLRGDEQTLRIDCIAPDEPRKSNRVLLAKKHDRFGLPEVALEYAPSARDQARREYLLQRGEDILRAAGGKYLRRERSLGELGSTHLHGTCRSGIDEATSVTDPDGRLHTVDNVSVVDGALMPYPGAVNPTLTIQALALRQAHRLLERGFSMSRMVGSA
ncbi:gluconate dehydrogenase [Microtetraspora sp. NBRC 13810]|uniref:GMC oxidoreductase n=1 Tax=Microtetraspora sp. NBRC 13810 TaxID=3030990 RepID=UPI0024A2C50B|nr:GMC family oxidoreductase [Microtetraspora sp. NBRC 13810]GLW05867.1 gluconate dehydrogenase [Microtetraspora sp. NBRC 13810]